MNGPARALISKQLNEGMSAVIAQREAGIGFGLPAELRQGVKIQAVTSDKLKRAIKILEFRPPFRQPNEEELLRDSLEDATKLAEDASGIWDAVHEIGDIVPGISCIVVSKTGALALHYADGVIETDEDYSQISALDNDNFHLVVNPYKSWI